MDATILTTRLEIPPLRARQMQRPRLMARLDAALQPAESDAARLVLVSAPAGFGKTTLLASWARASGQPVAWFSLDEGDNDTVRFLRYLMAALKRIDNRLGEGLQDNLQAASLSGQNAQTLIEQVLTILINQIHASGRRFILVLDDYHLIYQEQIHQATAFLLNHLPPHMLLAIASRSDPPLPLARLRARGQLIELRQAELRFSPDESSAFLRGLTGLELAEEEAQALDARTEGWAAGLQMAALAIQGDRAEQGQPRAAGSLDLSTFLEAFNGSNRYVLDYLVEEVFQDQPEDIQEFLLKTSILERMSGAMCAAVMEGLPNGTVEDEPGSAHLKIRAAHYQSILDHLDRSNLFILPLDSQRSWFRYHILFADLLRNRLEATFPEQIADLHGRASIWFERSGLPREAIQHALAARDAPRAAQLIETAALVALQQGEMVTLTAWVEALPVETVQSRPALDVMWLWARFFSGTSREAITTHIQRLMHAPPDVAAKAQILQAFLEAYQGRMATAGETLAAAMVRLSAQDVYFRGVANWLHGVIVLNSARLEDAFPILEKAARQAQETGNSMAVVMALSHLGVQLARHGQLEKARETLKKAVALASDRHGHVFPVAGMALAYLAELHREWDEVELAQRCVEQAISLSQGWRATSALTAYVVLARLHAMRGEYDQADRAIQIALQLAEQTDETRMDDYSILAERARLWALAGRYDRVADWARQLGSLTSGVPFSDEDQYIHNRMQKYYTLVLARLSIASGRASEALETLDELLPVIEQQGRTSMVIEILVLQAAAFHSLGNVDQAHEKAERAVLLAFKGRYFRLLVDEGEPLAQLLARLREERARQPEQNPELQIYLDRLLSAQLSPQPAAAPPPAKPGPANLVETISDREREVLGLLDSGLSTSAIAEMLNVSPHTVRSHIKSILGKLDAHSRYEALARARALGIL